MFSFILVLAACVTAQALPGNVGRIVQLYNTDLRISNDGYYSETHHVITSDGYILEINRIPYRRYQNASDASNDPSRPVVFLMHGLQNSAVSFLVSGPENSVAYNLADAGFDVWLGNARGAMNSRNHVQLDPDSFWTKKRFFDFSFEQIAVVDIPTMIDFILEKTGRSQLHYIGHSQGGTTFLILNSMRPEYNQKFASVNLLAAVGYQTFFPSVLLKQIAKDTDDILQFAETLGIVEVMGPNSNLLLNQACYEGKSEACDITATGNILGESSLLVETVAGSATKQFAHYGQNIRDGRFRRWNYGTFMNFIYYGSSSPPEYNLSLITTNVLMHYSEGDAVLSRWDVLLMASAMPNGSSRRVSRRSFTHTDFIVGSDAKSMVTDYIIEDIKKRNVGL